MWIQNVSKKKCTTVIWCNCWVLRWIPEIRIQHWFRQRASCQARSHYLSQCWLKSMSPYGVTITKPQWVNSTLGNYDSVKFHPKCNDFHARKCIWNHFYQMTALRSSVLTVLMNAYIASFSYFQWPLCTTCSLPRQPRLRCHRCGSNMYD